MRKLIVIFAAFAVLTGCGQAQDAEPAQALDRDAIENIVREYLVENPEVIEEALLELRMRAIRAEREAQEALILSDLESFFTDPRNPVIGPEDAPVQIVEFFDYRCSFCAVANEWLNQTLEEHGDQVRIVFKEFPIRGAESEEAARAALSVWRVQPESYLQVHTQLVTARGPLPSERIDQIIADAGVDVATVRARMNDEELDTHIDDVRMLAIRHNISGTPFFIVNEDIISGANMGALQSAVEAALENAS